MSVSDHADATCRVGAARHRLVGGGGEMSLERWVTGFTHYLAVERRLSLHTQGVYERDVRAWLGALPQRRNAEVAALLTRDGVVKFLARSRASGLSPRSLARRMAALRAFCRYLK